MIACPSARMALRAAMVLAVAVPLAAPVSASAKKKPKRPDLVVSSLGSPPASAARGVSFTVKAKVKNKGKASAKKSTLGLYLGKGTKHGSGDLKVTTKSTKKLKKGKSTTLTLATKVPATAPFGTYALFACADDKKKVKESKESNNCKKAKGSLTVPAPPPPPPPAKPAAPAFSLQDDFDWQRADNAAGVHANAGTNITMRLNMSNGVTGRSGYTRTNPGNVAPPTGANTAVTFTNLDDGATTVALPFAFRFHGQAYTSVSVGTNGYLSFGGEPAYDRPGPMTAYFAGGTAGVTSRFLRGVFPYFSDLDLTAGPAGTGSVTKTVVAGNSAVVFAWSTGFFATGALPLRTFDVVLFADGRIRYDYPGNNVVGGNSAFVLLTGGTGTASQDIVASNTMSVPTSSVLFTPKALGAVGAAPAGSTTLTLPRGSQFVSADAGCSLTLAPVAFRGGAVKCAVPALAAGAAVVKHVTFKMPAGIAAAIATPNVSLAAAYTAGATTLAEDEDINGRTSTQSASAAPTVTAAYLPPPAAPTATVPMTMTVTVGGAGNLVNPYVTIPIPAHTTFDSASPSCGPPAGGVVTCLLDSGSTGTQGTPLAITLTPDASLGGQMLTLQAAAHAANAPVGVGSGTSPTIMPIV